MDNDMKAGRGVRMQAPVCERPVSVDLSSDFSLPDYQPEIKRLLRVRAVASPAEKYVGAGNAQFSGTLDYCILYCANDGALYSATKTEEYQFSVPVEMTSDFEIGEGVLCDVELLPEGASARVAAPRKLTLRCKLRGMVRVYGIRAVEERVETNDERSLERLCGELSSARVIAGTGDALSLADEILFDSQWADLRVISAEGQVLVSEAMAGSGCVNCRGDVYLKLLCCHENGDGMPVVQLRKIPFSQSVMLDGCEVNFDACAHGVCSDLHVTVEEGRVLCDITVRLSARAQRNETVRYTRDLYSTTCESENHYTPLTLLQALGCINGNFSCNTTLSLEEAGMRGGMSVCDVTMTVMNATVERDGDRCYLTGKCRYHLILKEGAEMSAQELELPYRYEFSAVGDAITQYDATVDPVSCRARVDGERISLDAELAVCLATRGSDEVRVLSEARMGEAIKRTSAVCTVCYPARSDTLWSVAKKYHRTVDAVSAMNSLSDSVSADSVESLAGVAYLLV